MKLEIQYNQIPTCESLENYIEKRVYFAFNRFSNEATMVNLHLRDLNGPKGGMDKKCLASIRVKSRTFWSEAVEENLYKSVDAAIARLHRKLLRQFDRMKRRRPTKDHFNLMQVD